MAFDKNTQSSPRKSLWRNTWLAILVLVVASTVPAAASPNYAGIVIDAKTGKTLYSSSADSYRYPASLTKMMTLYLMFEAIEQGRLSKSTRIKFSAHAASEPPSKLGVAAGQSITAEQAIYALVTKSANDVATAVGEHLAGSEAAFARQMTNKARALGMKRTTFRNAHGLPDTAQKTTARDMATLGIALREHFPNEYRYFSTRSFRFGKATYGNHNRLLGVVAGVDGIKTGYTRASGFNLVTSVTKNGRQIVAVVMGGKTGASRNAQMKKLIDTYLPKASRRGNGDLVAKVATPTGSVYAELPEIGPVPRSRDFTDLRVALAYSEPPSAPDVPVPASRPVIGKTALIEGLNRQRATLAPGHDAKQAFAAALKSEQEPATPTGEGDVDEIVTASTALPSGWVIQIGATPDRNEAVKLLSEAQSRTGGLLASAQPFTVVTKLEGEQLHRARFAGFDSKSEAWSACKQLKKAGYGCWATEQ